jgi:hypothetical protein
VYSIRTTPRLLLNYESVVLRRGFNSPYKRACRMIASPQRNRCGRNEEVGHRKITGRVPKRRGRAGRQESREAGTKQGREKGRGVEE